MRVGIINYSQTDSPGGINKFVKELATSMSRQGAEISVIEPGVSPGESFEDSPYVVRKIRGPMFRPPLNSSKKFVREVISWINEESPDLVHIHGHMHLLSHQLIRAIKGRTEVPVVFSPHYDVATSSKISSFLLPIFNKIIGRKTANLCDHLFFSSEFESEAYINSMRGSKLAFSVIPLGVDFEISESVSRWDGVLELAYCGHLIRRKRVDRIIKLTKEIIRQSPEISLRVTVVGDGPELGSLMNLATDLKIDENISWRGFLERGEMLKTIKDADFFVLLSDSEAFGITVAESLASGTPVVISDNTALSEFSPEPGTIMAKDPDDFQQIAREILSLQGKEIKIGPFSDRIREWDKTGIEYMDKYIDKIEYD